MVHWSAAHLSEEFRVGDTLFDFIARRLDDLPSVGKLEQRVSVLFFPVGGECSDWKGRQFVKTWLGEAQQAALQ